MIETQSFAVIVLTVLLYYCPTIYRKIINNFKVSTSNTKCRSMVMSLSQLMSIPTIGNSDPLTSYIGAYRFQKHAKEMVQEGYYKVIGC